MNDFFNSINIRTVLAINLNDSPKRTINDILMNKMLIQRERTANACYWGQCCSVAQHSTIALANSSGLAIAHPINTHIQPLSNNIKRSGIGLVISIYPLLVGNWQKLLEKQVLAQNYERRCGIRLFWLFKLQQCIFKLQQWSLDFEISRLGVSDQDYIFCSPS